MNIDELRKHDTGFVIDKATPNMLVHKREDEAISEAVQRTLSTEECGAPVPTWLSQNEASHVPKR